MSEEIIKIARADIAQAEKQLDYFLPFGLIPL